MTEKPILSFCSRRPPPPYADLVSAGVWDCGILGPWHDRVEGKGGFGVRFPISPRVARQRADEARARGMRPWLLIWAPAGAHGLDRWLDEVATWALALGVDEVWIDLEPIHGIGPAGWQYIREATAGRMLVTSLRARLKPGTRIGVTHVQGPASEGVRAALEAADESAAQCYDGEPAQDAGRLEQVREEVPEVEVSAFMPAGFKAGATESELRRYVPGVLAAKPKRVIMWPSRLASAVSADAWRKGTALPRWAWDIYREHTRGRRVCGPGAP